MADGWISTLTRDFCRNLWLSENGWKSCFDIEKCLHRVRNTRMKITGLRTYPHQIFQAMSQLQSVHCEYTNSEGWTTLIYALSDALPSTVTSLKLFHGTATIHSLNLEAIFQNLPNLRRLDLGTCFLHCQCSLCSCNTEMLDWIESQRQNIAALHGGRVSVLPLYS